METKFKKQFEKTRWQIVYDRWDQGQSMGVITIQKELQRLLPYVIEVVASDSYDENCHLCVIGNANEHPLLRHLIEAGLLDQPTQDQGFSIAACPSPWSAGRKVFAIAGKDSAGMLHGAHFFNSQILNRYIGGLRLEDCPAALERLADLKMTEAPQVANRGIWTWGYPIYNYRAFIDNMARLRMNMLTIWNDIPPLNSEDLIEYAHKNGIRVIFGFAWGWGTTMDFSDAAQRSKIKDDVIAEYYKHYANLPLDGIYFQTLTEHDDHKLGDRTTAELACELVNDIAAALFEITPSLYLQFGLHASSIKGNYNDFKSLHPGVTIVWEDAGGIPYSYFPDTCLDWESGSNSKLSDVKTLEETLDYSMKIASIRGFDKEFALVSKGWSFIDWTNEFENHGAFILGERSGSCGEFQLKRRENCWNVVNQLWFKHYPVAAKFYREMLKAHQGPMTVTGLVEDGAFELNIQPSVALFAETLWAPSLTDNEILVRAMSPYYQKN